MDSEMYPGCIRILALQPSGADTFFTVQWLSRDFVILQQGEGRDRGTVTTGFLRYGQVNLLYAGFE
jgi:hypothetical protein